jgi:hypothetical protein
MSDYLETRHDQALALAWPQEREQATYMHAALAALPKDDALLPAAAVQLLRMLTVDLIRERLDLHPNDCAWAAEAIVQLALDARRAGIKPDPALRQ